MKMVFFDGDAEHVKGVIDAATFRYNRSNLKELIDLNYTFGEFLNDNPVLLTCKEYFGTDGASRGAKNRIVIDFCDGTLKDKNVDSFYDFTICNDTEGLTEDNLVNLWHSVNWTNGSAQVPDRLLGSLKNSNAIYTAWDRDRLIGLCSAIDDGLNAWISYMIVDADYQNSGIGGFLIDKMICHYRDFRIYVQTKNAAKFYKKHGFLETHTSLKLDGVSK